MAPSVTLRVVPFLVLLYYFDLMTRMNIANVHDDMLPALHISESAYSTAVGAFFFTYVIFQMPSNTLLRYMRASTQFGIVLMLIGLLGCSTAFVKTETEFILNRLALGVMQSGCYPGVVYIITMWFAEADRATKISYVDFATLGSSVSSGALASGILQIKSFISLQGWQWVLILEAAPAILVGILILFFMPNSPQTAKWLTDEQKLKYAEMEIANAKSVNNDTSFKHQIIYLFSNWKLWALSIAYFLNATAMYGYGFFAPSIIASLGVSTSMSNLITVPLAVFTFAIGLGYSKLSEIFTGQWARFAIGGSCVVTLLMLTYGGAVYYHHHSFAWVLMIAFAIFSNMGFSPFLVWVTSVIHGPPTSTALGIAFANSMANLGGISGPKLMSHYSVHYGYGVGIIAMAACLAMGVLILLIVYFVSAAEAKNKTKTTITSINNEGEKVPLLDANIIVEK